MDANTPFDSVLGTNFVLNRIFNPPRSCRYGAVSPTALQNSTMLDFSQRFSSLELPILGSVHLRDVQDIRTIYIYPSNGC